jgi:hypothetical protein
MRQIFASFILTILASACGASKQKENSELKFDSGEHQLIGDRAAGAVCNDPSFKSMCDVIHAVPRQDGKISFSYGELVAFSGDYYGTAAHLWSDTGEIRGINTVKDDMHKEVTVIEAYETGSTTPEETPYPVNVWGDFSSLPNGAILAGTNETHFGWNNMRTYAKVHALALKLASEAGRKAHDPATASEAAIKLREAIFYNGFADHFLSDGFAAGHLRVPRHEIVDYAAQIHGVPTDEIRKIEDQINEAKATYSQVFELLKHFPAARAFARSGVMSELLHDNDGNLIDGNDPLVVCNALGERWSTRGDSQLGVKTADEGLQPGANQATKKAVEASVKSLRELMHAYYAVGTPIDDIDTFEATKVAPFPCAGMNKPLSERFPENLPDSTIDKYYRSAAFHLRLPFLGNFQKTHIKEFFAALPSIMQQFSQNIRAQITNPDNTDIKHLAPEYVAAFSKIQ